MGSTSPDLVRQAVTARALSLRVDTGCLTSGLAGAPSTTQGYAHATTDAWQIATEPLIPEVEPSQRAHLTLFVDDRDTDDTMRSRSTHGDEPLVRAPLIVRFLYRLRPGPNKTPDWDRAARAGRAMLGHLLKESAAAYADADGSRQAPEFVLQRPNSGQLLRRIPIAGGDFLAVELRLDAIYQLSLAD